MDSTNKQYYDVKTWDLVDPENLTSADFLWLQTTANSVNYRAPEYQDLHSYSGRAQFVTRSGALHITTRNKKQESMMYLKFGNRLRLVMITRCSVDVSYPGY